MNFNYQPPTLGGRRIARKSGREVAHWQFCQVIAFAWDSGYSGRGYGGGCGIALRIPMRIRERGLWPICTDCPTSRRKREPPDLLFAAREAASDRCC
jgi:hypothetical protein